MTAEQQARNMLKRMGIEDAQSFTAGDVVELANLIADRDRLKAIVKFIESEVADSGGGELFPVGPSDVKFAPDGNTVLEYVPPWTWMGHNGSTFLEAIENAMAAARVADNSP